MMNLPLIIACPGGPAIFLIFLIPLFGLIPGILSVAFGVGKRETRISAPGTVAGGISILLGVAIIVFFGWPSPFDNLIAFLIITPVPLGSFGLWLSLRRKRATA